VAPATGAFLIVSHGWLPAPFIFVTSVLKRPGANISKKSGNSAMGVFYRAAAGQSY
jgi:hypothetical protein